MLAGSLRRQKLSRREADGLERLLGPLLDILGGVGLSRSDAARTGDQGIFALLLTLNNINNKDSTVNVKQTIRILVLKQR